MKETYEFIKNRCEYPVALLQYTYKDLDGIIQIGKSLNVDFSEDEINIEKMKRITLIEGFMFFNNSKEGMKFFKDNPIKFYTK